MSDNSKKRILVATIDVRRALKSGQPSKEDMLGCLSALRYEIDAYLRAVTVPREEMSESWV